jgi:hypothetical protein
MEQLPMEDLDELIGAKGGGGGGSGANGDPEVTVGASGVLTGSATTERVRSRAKRSGTSGDDASADEVGEALRWAEANIPGLDDEDVDALANVRAGEDEQAQLLRTELSKLN